MQCVQNGLKRPAQFVADQEGTKVGRARAVPGADLNLKPNALPDGSALERSDWMIRIRGNGAPARSQSC